MVKRDLEKPIARVAELADALDLGSSGQPWGFESPLSHHFSLLLKCELNEEQRLKALL